MLRKVADLLELSPVVKFRPIGNSMTPRIKSGNQVTVSSHITGIKKDDVVLCRVHGVYMLHKVLAIQDGRYLIGNNHGRVNGWTRQVYGVVIQISK